jgi:hypothetical protein
MIDWKVRWDDIKGCYEENRISVSGGENFIEIYDDALPKDICDRLIQKFDDYDARGLCRQGASDSHVDKTLKDSTDLIVDGTFMQDPSNAEFNALLGPVVDCLSSNVVKYLMKYHSLLPPVFKFPNNQTVLHQEMLISPEVAMQVMKSNISVLYMQLQRYLPPGQGYHAWHYESGSRMTMDRVLFPIIYLNDVDSGGETEFYYWDTKVKPKAGRLIIAPGSFTHTHRMTISPLSNAKYILTTWYTMRKDD